MYSLLNEEVARMARNDAERRARFNAMDPATVALHSEPAMPGTVRRATARAFLRAGLALLGERHVAATLLPFTEEESAC